MIQIAGGPFFYELRPGLVVSDAPTCTLTDGLAAAHAAIVGNRLRLSLDAELSRLVAGARLANPALVWDVAIGQSTLLTHRAIANLFYRGLRFSRFPHIGDTLRTATEVVALRQNTKRPGRAATGLAVLRIRTTDQEHREILDFMRCAMLPLRDPEGETTHAADLEQIALQTPKAELGASIADWRLDLFSAEVGSDHFADLVEGSKWEVAGGGMVTSAPQLARLTGNVSSVHHDGATNALGR